MSLDVELCMMDAFVVLDALCGHFIGFWITSCRCVGIGGASSMASHGGRHTCWSPANPLLQSLLCCVAAPLLPGKTGLNSRILGFNDYVTLTGPIKARWLNLLIFSVF
jgi:hypothetical protein